MRLLFGLQFVCPWSVVQVFVMSKGSPYWMPTMSLLLSSHFLWLSSLICLKREREKVKREGEKERPGHSRSVSAKADWTVFSSPLLNSLIRSFPSPSTFSLSLSLSLSLSFTPFTIWIHYSPHLLGQSCLPVPDFESGLRDEWGIFVTACQTHLVLAASSFSLSVSFFHSSLAFIQCGVSHFTWGRLSLALAAPFLPPTNGIMGSLSPSSSCHPHEPEKRLSSPLYFSLARFLFSLVKMWLGWEYSLSALYQLSLACL